MFGVYFNGVHSFDDLNLVLSKTEIPPAIAKTNFVDIPGGDGYADLTEAMGEVKFKGRECSFTFTVFPTDNFEEKKREVSNLLNGKRCKIIEDKDPDYYWKGRCFVDEYASDKNLHKIVIGAVVEPYKLKDKPTKVIVPAGTMVVKNIWNGRKTVVPTITNTAKATIMFNGATYTIEPGVHKILNIELKQGKNQMIVTSAASVELVYQEGDL